MKEYLHKVITGHDLSYHEARAVFTAIFEGSATASQIAAFLAGMRMKQETEDEIAAAASVVREKAEKISVHEGLCGFASADEPVLDTCGTGGSGVRKFNISTAVAFVVASAGVKVAKHGNRSASSHCGSADVLDELGVSIDSVPSVTQEAIRTVGIGFLFAPLYHKAFKAVVPVRREIGFRTLFNILGPLCNPAAATHQLLGVSECRLTHMMARVLHKLGTRRAFVVYGEKVKDEVSLAGKTYVSFLDKGRVTKTHFTPSQFGLKKKPIESIAAQSVQESARIIRNIFSGTICPQRDWVLANAGVCLYLLGKVNNLKEGVRTAAALIDGGKVLAKLDELRKFLTAHG